MKLKGARSIFVAFALVSVTFALALFYLAFSAAKIDSISYPNGARFAIAICDDTDDAVLQNIEPIYNFLYQEGVVSTKTVWVYDVNQDEHGYSYGDSLENKQYREFILSLKNKGYEIALHGARGASSSRPVIKRALNDFSRILGSEPEIHINHRMNEDNLYWGSKRLSVSVFRLIYDTVLYDNIYFGDDPQSPFFWGDLALETVKYSRSFSFYELNLAKIKGPMPYFDPNKPYVKNWFHTSDGHDVESFISLLSKENLDELEQSGGYSIIYTHFGKEFWHPVSGINSAFKRRIKDLVSRDVWITTTGELLAHLEKHQSYSTISTFDLFLIELRWVMEKIIYGRS